MSLEAGLSAGRNYVLVSPADIDGKDVAKACGPPHRIPNPSFRREIPTGATPIRKGHRLLLAFVHGFVNELIKVARGRTADQSSPH